MKLLTEGECEYGGGRGGYRDQIWKYILTWIDVFLRQHKVSWDLSCGTTLVLSLSCSAGFDWLDVHLEVRSLCYWPTPQTGNQRIEECLHKKYGISPLMSSELS